MGGPSLFLMNNSKRISERKRFLREKMQGKEEARFSLDINTGIEKLRPEDLLQRETPTSVNDAQVNARKWHRENWFVEQMIHLKLGFFNYGLKILPRKKTDRKAVEKFLEQDEKAAELHRYIESVQSEALLQDTVVSFWREEAKTTPFLLLPEFCRYTDAMGIEKLRVNLNYKKADLEDAERFGATSFSNDMIRRYTGKKEILLEERFDEYFKVLTVGLKGQGFGWPRLRRVFRTLSQNESMEVGESMLALAGRLVERTHRIGFEVKSSANAMRQADYLWKKQRAAAIEKFYTGRSGFVETTRQFDHDTEYIWVDPKHYDNRKWMTVIDRLMWWGGPLAFMLMAKTPNPNLLVAFLAEATRFREWVGRHLEYVILRGFELPVRLQWSNRCFLDLRLFWDMMKFYTQQGPLSLTSGLEAATFDPQVEAERKQEEAEPKRLKQLTPLWDPNHNRGGKPGEEPGRPKVSDK
jgi:hypothetical protein